MSMENHPPCGELVSEDANSIHELQSTASQKQFTHGAIGEDLINDLENSLSKVLHIQNAQESECASDGDETSDIVEGIVCEEGKIHQSKSELKHLSNCATFPCPSELLSLDASSGEEDKELETALQGVFYEESKHSAYSRSMSLPTPLKLVSAMKGSREKQGALLKKLTVKWAPDVYDPQPSSLCHTVKGKKQKSRKSNDYKKNGKGKQKGNTSRGSSGKDKKQFRKIVGTSNKCYKSLDVRDRIVSNEYTDPDKLEDFDVGSPDAYCGSSFLKKSLTKVHFSVAEAL